MIYGLDFSSYATISDARRMLDAGRQPVDFVYTRGWAGYRVDASLAKHKQILLECADAGVNGPVLAGAYMWLAYDAGSLPGDSQAADFWNAATAGENPFRLPPAVDVERRRYLGNGGWQYAPFPAAPAFMEHLKRAVEALSERCGRRPMFYTNVDVILNYLYPELIKPTGAWLLECPLWIAHWRVSQPFSGYRPNPWPAERWYLHQLDGDMTDWPGIDDVDVNRFNGSRAELEAWCGDATWFPGKAVEALVSGQPVELVLASIAEDLAALRSDVAYLRNLVR